MFYLIDFLFPIIILLLLSLIFKNKQHKLLFVVLGVLIYNLFAKDSALEIRAFRFISSILGILVFFIVNIFLKRNKKMD